MVRKRKPRSLCVANSLLVADYARKFAQEHWSFLGFGSEKKWHGTHENKSNGEWDDVADIMMTNSSGSGHLVFRGSNAFERRDLKSKGKEQLSIHFNDSDEIVEVILHTVVSVNQLSVYEQMVQMCEEFVQEMSKSSWSTGKPVAPDNLKSMEMSPEVSIKLLRPMQEHKVTCSVNSNRSSQISQNTFY